MKFDKKARKMKLIMGNLIGQEKESLHLYDHSIVGYAKHIWSMMPASTRKKLMKVNGHDAITVLKKVKPE